MKKDKQCTYNVILSCVHIKIVAVQREKHYIFWVYDCSLIYPASQSSWAVLYCQPWPARLYRIFPHYLINSTVFRKAFLNIKYVLILCTSFSETFLIQGKIQPEIVVNMHRPSFKMTFIIISCNWSLNFIRVLEKYYTYNFTEIRPAGAELFCADRLTDRQTDVRTKRHGEANNCFPQFRERA